MERDQGNAILHILQHRGQTHITKNNLAPNISTAKPKESYVKENKLGER